MNRSILIRIISALCLAVGGISLIINKDYLFGMVMIAACLVVAIDALRKRRKK